MMGATTPYPPSSASFSIFTVLLLAREFVDMISLFCRFEREDGRLIDKMPSLDIRGRDRLLI